MTLRTLQYGIIAIIAAAISACAGSDDFDPLFEASQTKIITPKTVTFGGNETTASFTIEATSNWEIQGKPDWFNLSQTTGNGNATITLTTTDEENPSPTGSRQATLTIISGDRTNELLVEQTKAAAFLSITDIPDNGISFGTAASSRVFNIRTNTKWKLSYNAKWMTISPSEGTGSAQVTVSVAENSTEETLTDNVSLNSVSPSGLSASFSVTQTGIQTSLTGIQTVLYATATAGSGTITIGSGDASWRVVADADWLTIDNSTLQGKGAGAIKVAWKETTELRERQAHVTIKRLYSDEVIETCTVIQQAGSTPVVSAPTVSAHKTYATISCKATAEMAITDYGIEFYPKANAGAKTTIKGSSINPDGSYAIEVTELTSMTTYCVRAFATNNVGTTYSELIEFTTTGSKPAEDDNPIPEL